MNPQIEFRHVLGELSVNRNDPCEVLRELISNSYDAKAKNIWYSPLPHQNGFAFLDDGTGLSKTLAVHGITPWEAFFSIGKSTKKKGESIGYKCQGSKLCFACNRILVATKSRARDKSWDFKAIDNPRSNLDTSFDIAPASTTNISNVLDTLFPTPTADTINALTALKAQIEKSSFQTGTLVLIDGLDTESFGKHFAVGKHPEDSYVFNYIRFYTCQGDVRHLTKDAGFTPNQRTLVNPPFSSMNFAIQSGKKQVIVPFGYPYLLAGKHDPNIKSPAEISRLRDGRFSSRSAKTFSVGSDKFSIVLAIDGNRRALDDYKALARKGRTASGIRLSDHRGMFIAVKGIKICKYQELLSTIEGYEVLSEGDSNSHYLLILEGDFDLVTNRNALSKKAYDTLTNPDFKAEIKKFLDAQKSSDKVFAELIARLKKESSETLLNDQIEQLNNAKLEIKSRDRFRIADEHRVDHLFLSPQPGEEYLVGILYSQLANLEPKASGTEKFWKKVITFSTQGIDSLGLRDEASSKPLAEENVCSIEYKFDFNNSGPFNHALAVVDFIVAWEVNVDVSIQVKDSYTCFGQIRATKLPYLWEIYDIENEDGGRYEQTVQVICLKSLIDNTFQVKHSKPVSK
jgi:hypothetical protein